MKIFLAGATGVIGRRLIPLLRQAGHAVTGTTRSAERLTDLQKAGAEAVLVDVFDAAALADSVARAAPHVVIHQLTDLSASQDPAAMDAARERNARLRIEGTRNLMAAAKSAGAGRVIAQSIAWLYAGSAKPHSEIDPLDMNVTGMALRTVEALIALEQAVLGTPPVEGIVLRYGRLYGPGTCFSAPSGPGSLHADAAAQAALLAVTQGTAGIYNVAEDDGTLSIEK